MYLANCNRVVVKRSAPAEMARRAFKAVRRQLVGVMLCVEVPLETRL